MSGKKEKKDKAKKAKLEVEGDDSLKKETAPTEKVECKALEKKRKSTTDQTQQSKLKQLVSTLPRHREDKLRSQYKEEHEQATKAKADLKDDREELNQAIKDGKIWSGFRGTKDGLRGIGWTPGFAKKWWDCYATHKFYDGGWVCAKGLDGCEVPAVTGDHTKLEIGHKDSFYKHISLNVDGVEVCDGAKHWLVYLVSDIVKFNQEPENLEPQCHPCNMKQKNEESGEMQPFYAGDCRGKGCEQVSIEELIAPDSKIKYDCTVKGCSYHPDAKK